MICRIFSAAVTVSTRSISVSSMPLPSMMGKKGTGLGGEKPEAHLSPSTSPSHLSNRTISSSFPAGLSRLLPSNRSAPGESVRWRGSPYSLRSSTEEEEVECIVKQKRSASCPSPNLQGLRLAIPQSQHPASLISLHSSSSSSLSSPFPSSIFTLGVGAAVRNKDETSGVPESGRRGSVLSRLMRRVLVERGGSEKEEKEEAELHLYAVSLTSRIYLHLLSSWNCYMIRSTLMLDPVYRKRCGLNSESLSQKQCQMSWERTASLFSQLSGELLQEGIGLESLYLLLQELNTAAHRNIAIKKLFWRSSDLCPFLVKTLEEALQRLRDPANRDSRADIADRLLLCTLVTDTLSLMMREMEVEPARGYMLTAKRGALSEKLLLALVCDPEIVLQDSAGVEESGQMSLHADLQGLLGEYLDATTALLFQLLVLTQQANGSQNHGPALTVGWFLKNLQSHSSTPHFLRYLVRRVISALSGSHPPLSPAQSVLLYQQCRILMACLQHSNDLGQYIRTEFGEEFRYYVTMSLVEERLPPQYTISQSTLRLVSQLQLLVLRNP